MISITILAICAAIMAMQLKTFKSEYGVFIAVGACTIIFFYAISRLAEIIHMISGISEKTSIDASYIKLLIKIVGITYLAEFASDVCRDCGYSSLANQVRIFGKLSVLSISIPIIEALVTGMEGIL